MKASSKYLKIEEIELIPEFRRQKPKTIAEQNEFATLELSLKEIGISDPFVVYQKDGRYLLCDGYLRYDIIKQFIRDDISARIDYDKILCEVVGDPDITPAQLRLEANKRSPITPTQMAEGFRDLNKKYGMTVREIAPKFGLSYQSISNYLEILKCIPEVRRGIDRKIYPMSAGKQYCVLTPEGQKLLHEILMKKYDNPDRIFRSQIETEKAHLDERYFIVPKETRMKRSEKIREKKRGATIRKPLDRDLITRIDREEEELRLLDRLLLEKRDHYLNFLKRWELAFRVPEIRSYVSEKYPDDYETITRFIGQELGG
jgi:hypothetical protein